MVRSRSPVELLRELDDEARFGSEVVLVVVGETGPPLLIPASHPERIQQLESALAAGGEPVGLIRVTEDAAHGRLFCEYADEENARNAIARSSAALARRCPRPKDGSCLEGDSGGSGTRP